MHEGLFLQSVIFIPIVFIKGRGKVEANTTMNTGKPLFLGILRLVNQSKALFV